MSSIALENLKSQLKALGGFHEREYLHSSVEGLDIAIPKGAITQVIGPGKTECITKFLSEYLREAPQSRIAWIENELSIYPNGLMQRKINLDRILFVESGKETVWATLQILGSSLFDIVILSLTSLSQLRDLRAVRRLQLAAEKAKCTLLLLADETLEAWPVTLHLQAFQQDNQHKWRVVGQRA